MEFDEFLKQALPPLGYRWRPLRRRGVRRKIQERLRQLHYCRWEDYLEHLLGSETEQKTFVDLLPITVSRFFRNHAYYQFLRERLFPSLLEAFASRKDKTLRVWSLGAAAGEEAYSIAICWDHEFQEKFPDWDLEILATDKEGPIIERGQKAIYAKSSLKEFPEKWLPDYFEIRNGNFHLKDSIKDKVHWQQHDFLMDPPIPGSFHLIFCCYSLFTYYSTELQAQFLRQLNEVLWPKGFLVLGKKENLPPTGFENFQQVKPTLKVYQKLFPQFPERPKHLET